MTRRDSDTTDVLVVGAGPTGLTLAGELLRRGVSCRIIDRAAKPASTSRAVGVHSRTMELFAEMGILEQALAQGVKIVGTTVLRGDLPLAHFSVYKQLPAPYPFVLLLPQANTEKLLAGLLAEHGGTVEWGRELVDLHQEAGGVIATASDGNGGQESLRAGWAVGCDGYDSRVRRLLGIGLSQETDPEAYAVADVALDWDLSRQDTYVWLHDDGLLAAMPLPGDHRWRLFASFRSGDAAQPPKATTELFQKLLAERALDDTTRISDPAWMSEYVIQRRVAERYRQGRVFLAGDAAHVETPLGGQGLNAGVQDAYNLAWKLALVVQGRMLPALLDTYEAERLPVARAVLEGSDANANFLLARNPALRFTDRDTLAHVARLEFVQAAMAREASELLVNYRGSALSRNYIGDAGRLSASGPEAGDRAPDGACRRFPDLTPTTLYREWCDGSFRLVLFSDGAHESNPDGRLARIAAAAQTHLGGLNRTFLVSGAPPEKPETGARVLIDTEGELRGAYHAPGEGVFLVRPDGYIAYRGKPADEEPFLNYLASLGFS